jgi:hypothetical protein
MLSGTSSTWWWTPWRRRWSGSSRCNKSSKVRGTGGRCSRCSRYYSHTAAGSRKRPPPVKDAVPVSSCQTV